MGRSRRSRVVPLTKTKKKPAKDHKLAIVDRLRKYVDKHENIFVFSHENMTTSPFRTLQNELGDSKFCIGKNKVMKVALGKTEEDSYKPMTHKLSEALGGECGVLFTNKPQEEIINLFQDFTMEEFARGGAIAKETIILQKGSDVLKKFSHSMEPYLRKLGLHTSLINTEIHLNADYLLAKEGEAITPEQARLLEENVVMCILNFVLFFKIHYKCDYGDSVYVTGNLDALGNWNPDYALRLTWSEDDNWSFKLKIAHDNTQNIEYKYFIGPTEGPKLQAPLKWEKGPNRIIGLESTVKLIIRLEDLWEHSKIKIALWDYPIRKSFTYYDKKVILYTNLSSQVEGVELDPRKYTLAKKDREELYWVGSLNIPNTMEQFKYRFQIISKQTSEVINDLVQRKFQLKKFPKSRSLSDAYLVRGGSLMKVDFNFEVSLNYSQITSNVFCGSFPQTARDIDELASLGIRAVLNLQTVEDIENFSINWDLLKKYYQEKGIEIEHLPIVDNFDEIRKNIHKLGEIIDNLVKSHGAIYVHCNVGKNRSPHAIVYYLWNYKDYDLHEAISHVKSKRPKVKLTEKMFTFFDEGSLNKSFP